jgi:hypothetical protein
MVNGLVAAVREALRRPGRRAMPLMVAAAHAGVAIFCLLELFGPKSNLRF